jgi:transcriptional regulator with XRE-family HTH domain
MNERFGEFIRDMRKKKLLTQKNLAKLLNISDKAISKWEVGDSYPDISLLKPIAEVFDISVDELLECSLDNKKQKSQITRKLILFNIASNLFLVVMLLVFLLMNILQRKSDEASVEFVIHDLETFTSVVLISTIALSLSYGLYNFLQYRKYERGKTNEETNTI